MDGGAGGKRAEAPSICAQSSLLPEKAQTKHNLILDSLRKSLEAGHYRDGGRLPSEAELTRRFKVSRMTVVKAIQQLQQEGLVVRKVGSGTYGATRLAQTEGLVFGLLIPDLGQTEIFEPVCRGMVRSPQAKKHSLLWGHSIADSEDKGEQAKQLCQHFLEQSVNGVFFAPLEFTPDRGRVNQQILATLAAAKVPVVLLDRCGLDFPASADLDQVGLDNRRAGYILIQHLIGAGAQRVAFVKREGSVETVETRIAGCREALFAHGKVLDEVLTLIDPAVDEQALRRLKAHGIDAIVCANDQTAARLMKALLAFGIKVPEEMRIVGFDDVSYGTFLPVPLTTIHQPCGAIGAAAMAAMLDRIAHPELPARLILLEGKLIVRESCGAAKRKG
jgi:GntR family transcriptional regulator of arabinose operon